MKNIIILSLLIYLLFFVIICSLLVDSCDNNFSENMLCGKYVSNEYREYDTIIILQNHTFLEKIKNNGKFYQSNGIWKLNSASWITFYNIRNRDTSIHYWLNEGYSARVKKTINGEMRIIYASEEGIYWKKVSE